jgi:hypothetical protein
VCHLSFVLLSLGLCACEFAVADDFGEDVALTQDQVVGTVDLDRFVTPFGTLGGRVPAVQAYLKDLSRAD